MPDTDPMLLDHAREVIAGETPEDQFVGDSLAVQFAMCGELGFQMALLLDEIEENMDLQRTCPVCKSFDGHRKDCLVGVANIVILHLERATEVILKGEGG